MLNAKERRRAESMYQFRELVEQYGKGFAVRLLDVHPDTVERWLTGESKVPKAVLIALQAALGRLPHMQDKGWDGIRIESDGLIYVDGWNRGFTPGDIRAIPYQRQMVRHLEVKLKETEQKLQDVLQKNNTAANDPLILKGQA